MTEPKSNIVRTLRENFFARLNRRTGWGKLEIKREFNDALSDTVLQILAELEQKGEPSENS